MSNLVFVILYHRQQEFHPRGERREFREHIIREANQCDEIYHFRSLLSA